MLFACTQTNTCLLLRLQGLGMPVDPVAAFEHYRCAAELGSHPRAAACCGDMLYSGIGCVAKYVLQLQQC
jgi:TPR repeat protein